MRSPGALAVATLLVIAVVAFVAAGCVVGATRGSIPGDPGTDAQAIRDVHIHFDHPIQRLRHLSYGVAARDIVDAAPPCVAASDRRIVSTVHAYTFLGDVAARARVDCGGSVETLP